MYLIIFSSLLSFILQLKGIKIVGPIKVSIYTNSSPVYSVALSYLILKQTITWI
ncbi:MAG: EamA family transporter [Fusobacteriaceae bacterium]